MRKLTLVILLLLALTACTLGRDDGDDNEDVIPTSTTAQNVGGKPSVSITSPTAGSEFNVNDEIFVNVNASDQVGVTRVQLTANGQVVRTITSETTTGDKEKNLILDYTPRSTGEVTLRVVAYRGATPSDPAEVSINIKSGSAQPTQPSSSNTNVPVIDPNDPTCRALISTGLNMRTGPSTDYQVIRVLASGEVLPITGRLGNNSWWQIRSGSNFGWVSSQYTTTYGNCLNVPVIAPPASPTPPNQPTVVIATATSAPTNTPIPSATPIPDPADLIIPRFDQQKTIVIPAGQNTVTEVFSVVVTNNGEARARPFTMTLRILEYDMEPIEISVGALRGGESTTFANIQVPFTRTGVANQVVTLQVRADSGDVVGESNEANNTAELRITQVER